MSNKIISDYRSEALQGSIKLVDDKGNEKICVGTKPIILSNQWKPVRKGDIITMDGKDYRVLKLNGSVAEVMRMYYRDLQQNFSLKDSNVYANSTLDTYLQNEFYNSLNVSIQNAIIEKTFTQDEWAFASSASSETCSIIYHGAYRTRAIDYKIGLANAAYGESISRKCYVLSVQDIIDYLEVTRDMIGENTTLTPENLRKMFGGEEDTNVYPLWFRSAELNTSNRAFSFDRKEGYLHGSSVAGDLYICPAFQIDLSKVDYAIL